MLLTAPDYSSSSLVSSISHQQCNFLFSKGLRLRLNSVTVSRTRKGLRCRASLITNPDSFEVGRLLGSYGFMNVTSYSGLQDFEYSAGDLGRFRVPDVGEGSVKISLFAGFMKEE